jgi:cell division protein FtsI (penicillin-binding protein 3)
MLAGRLPGRRASVMLGFLLVALVLIRHAVNLQLTKRDFLQSHGDARSLRVIATEAHRGMITDRNGEPMAISTPVNSVWANPKILLEHKDRWAELAKILDLPKADLAMRLQPRTPKTFVYLRRQISPDIASAVTAAAIPGVNLTNEYRRYYPAGEVAANMLGFTNVDDRGQEGIELAFDAKLRGTPGLDRVVQDRLGRVVEHVERVRPVAPGQDLALSIDRRLQYFAYRELKKAVTQRNAAGGLMVILDAHTGEVLAMVNQPSYNPNNRGQFRGENFRNRTVTDLFEPGSTIKPFTVAAGLESGLFKPTTMINCQADSFRGHYVKDVHPNGMLSVASILQKSSNVGVTKIALAIEPEQFWNVLNRAGFGQLSGIEFPGEISGRLEPYRNWRGTDVVSLSYGYFTNITAIELARAYGVFASAGLLRPVTILKQDHPVPGERVMPEATALAVREMLQAVTEVGGTAKAAAVEGYLVAGKTGTVKKNNDSGYTEKSYRSIFAGFFPASAPRLIGVVVIDDPQSTEYYGGLVAAPVFASVMHEAARLFNLTPDRALAEGSDGTRSPVWPVAIKTP